MKGGFDEEKLEKNDGRIKEVMVMMVRVLGMGEE
jgi:hypothetical protein